MLLSPAAPLLTHPPLFGSAISPCLATFHLRPLSLYTFLVRKQTQFKRSTEMEASLPLGEFPLSTSVSVRMILFAGVQLSVKNTTHERIVADLAERGAGREERERSERGIYAGARRLSGTTAAIRYEHGLRCLILRDRELILSSLVLCVPDCLLHCAAQSSLHRKVCFNLLHQSSQ